MSQIDWSKAPEGATHWDCRKFVSPSFMRKPEGSTHWMFYGGGEWHLYGALVDTEEAKLIKRPQPWNGEGLPPVGTNAENRECGVVTVLAHGVFRGQTMIICQGDDTIVTCTPDQLNPIRTPEQIAAEERRKSAIALYEAVMNFGKLAFDRLPLDRQEHYLKLVDAGWQQVKS